MRQRAPAQQPRLGRVTPQRAGPWFPGEPWPRTGTPGMQIHAACAAREGWGVLLLGPSGSGKSDLLLRLLQLGWALVADDRVELESDGASLWASPPLELAGLLEVRGIGLIRFPALDRAPLALAIELSPASAIERLPEPRRWGHRDLAASLPPPISAPPPTSLPLVALDPWTHSAEARLGVALDLALGRRQAVASALGDAGGAR